MNKFKIGDVVRFIRGGPFMTVQDVFGNNVSVVWFDKDRKSAHRDNFCHSILEPYSRRSRHELVFEVGDKVSLDYCGPVMTVENIINDLVSVIWFNKTTDYEWEGPFRDRFLGQVLLKEI